MSVAVLTRQGKWGAREPELPFPVHRLPLRGLGYALAGACWLASRRRPFHVLHAHQALSAALAAVLAKRLRPKSHVVVKVACSGDWSDFRLAQVRPFYRSRLALLRAVDRFVILNHESAADLRAVGLGEVPARLIPNGVDTNRFTPATTEERRAIRASLGLCAEEPIALFVGRLERRKGLDLLLTAWAEMIRRPALPRLLLVGPGNVEGWMAQVRTLGLENRITFLGGREDVACLYRAADLFVFPSRSEGCPNAVLEAMASGLPVVATDVAGNREVVGGDRSIGWLVPTGDPGALAEVVRMLAGSPDLRQEMSAAARVAAEERFAIHRVGAQYVSLYEELVG
jgi:glycosyltransferase involved in cell wall biosynthesis